MNWHLKLFFFAFILFYCICFSLTNQRSEGKISPSYHSSTAIIVRIVLCSSLDIILCSLLAFVNNAVVSFFLAFSLLSQQSKSRNYSCPTTMDSDSEIDRSSVNEEENRNGQNANPQNDSHNVQRDSGINLHWQCNHPQQRLRISNAPIDASLNNHVVFSSNRFEDININ